jgi:hypothetical protein
MSDFHHIRQLGHNLGQRRWNGEKGKFPPSSNGGVQQYGIASPLDFGAKFAISW